MSNNVSNDETIPVSLHLGGIEKDEPEEIRFPSVDSALELYESLRVDKKSFHPGTDYITVSIFDDYDKNAHFGDPDNESWVVLDALSPSLDPPPAEKLYKIIQEEYPGGGMAMVQLWRSNKKRQSKKSHNPIFLPVAPSYGDNSMEKQKYMHELRRQDRLEREASELRKKSHDAEISGLQQMIQYNLEQKREDREFEREMRLRELELQREAKDKDTNMFDSFFKYQMAMQEREDNRKERENDNQGNKLSSILQQMQEASFRQTQQLAQMVQGSGRRYDDEDNDSKQQQNNLIALMMQNQQQQSNQQTQMMMGMFGAIIEAMKGQNRPSNGDDKYVHLLQQNHQQSLQMMDKVYSMQIQANNPTPELGGSLSSLSKNLKAIQEISETMGGGGGGGDESSSWGVVERIAEKVAPEAIERLFSRGKGNDDDDDDDLMGGESSGPTPEDYYYQQQQALQAMQQQQQIPQQTNYQPEPQQSYQEPPQQTNSNNQPDQSGEVESSTSSLEGGIFGVSEKDSEMVEKDLIGAIQGGFDPKEYAKEIPDQLVGMIKGIIPKKEFVAEIQTKAKDSFLKSVTAQKWLREVRDVIYG